MNNDTEIALLELEHRYGKEVRDRVEQMGFVIPKTGRWIGIDDEPHEVWECDQCGCLYEEMPGWTPPYCPNCGADMRGEEEWIPIQDPWKGEDKDD